MKNNVLLVQVKQHEGKSLMVINHINKAKSVVMDYNDDNNLIKHMGVFCLTRGSPNRFRRSLKDHW